MTLSYIVSGFAVGLLVGMTGVGGGSLMTPLLLSVFRLSPEGVELLEVAPGIDIERDVVAHMEFPPIMRDVQLMDAGVFQAEWGRLAERVGGR